MKSSDTLDFSATSSLYNALAAQPVSRAKADVEVTDAKEQTKYRTSRAETTWVPKNEKEAALSDVSMLTKTAWHIGQGYNIGSGFTNQHGWNAAAGTQNVDPPRLYEYAGLTVKKYTKTSGPYAKDQRNESRVATMLASKKERHEKEVVDFEAKLKSINEAFEPMVVASIKRLRENLKKNEEDIELLFHRLADEFLTRIDMAQLQGVWTSYQEQSQLRENYIKEFTEQLDALETQRAAIVEGDMRSLAQVLVDIAWQLEGPIDRYLEEVAMQQNEVKKDWRNLEFLTNLLGLLDARGRYHIFTV
mmetsp:Transcript_47866/g.126975  ORF Transcript_47866/g.126975 Transcript_47866/m.126975 type:complete len:304 (+) Transcript_47866:1127-2038(+)